MKILETCIQYGQPFLLENIKNELDPMLESILYKKLYKKGANTLIKLGDVEINYNVEFKLFMTTDLPNPHYLPEITTKINLINFTLTNLGLEE